MTIVFEFGERRNVSALSLYTNNWSKNGAREFETARVYFSDDTDGLLYSDRYIRFEADEDGDVRMSMASRWIRIAIPHRLAKRLKVQLTLAADWLLLSEVKFESSK